MQELTTLERKLLMYVGQALFDAKKIDADILKKMLRALCGIGEEA